MYSRHTPGIGETGERLFRRFPLGCPLTILTVGAVLSLLIVSDRSAAQGSSALRFLPVVIVILLIGLAVLPFGIITKINRRRNAIVLRCP